MFFLCLTRTVRSGWRAGLATGLGIATADGLYAAIAAGGIGVAATLLTGSQRWITVGGGIALAILGLRALLAAPGPVRGPEGTHAGSYLSALTLTLANPATIVSFGAIFAAIGVRSLITVLATAAGSLTWWVLLVAAAFRVRAALGERTRFLRWLSGLALVAFGVVAVVSALLH